LETTHSPGRSWLWLILLIPYIALLWLPFYNDTHPSFAGFPFFYWYQLLWVPLTSLLIYVVYRGHFLLPAGHRRGLFRCTLEARRSHAVA